MPFLFYNVARGGDKIKTNVSGIIASIRSFQTEEREDRKEKGKKGREKKRIYWYSRGERKYPWSSHIRLHNASRGPFAAVYLGRNVVCSFRDKLHTKPSCSPHGDEVSS